MKIICIDPQTDPLWHQLIAQRQSSVFHSPKWIHVLTETYALNVRALVLLDSVGDPQAGILFCRISDLMGERIVSLPFSDYCDPFVSNLAQWNCLLERLVEERCPIVLRCLHTDLPLADQRFTVVKQAKWHSLHLQPDLDTLWQGLHASTQRAIRKAQRDGLVVRIAEKKEELRSFFEMHLRVRKYKYQYLAQPYQFFENIWRHFIEEQNGLILLAIYQDQIVGSILFLKWKETLYYKFNASVLSHLSHRPNDLLIWEGIQYAKKNGYTHLDFGLSDWDQAGLVRYKRKFASEEKPISFLRYVPDTYTAPYDTQMSELLTHLTGLLTDESVPDSVTDRAGEILYRFFT